MSYKQIEQEQVCGCALPFPLDILWWAGPRGTMRPVDADAAADCVLVVGLTRPKMAAALLSVMMLSLFLTFHVLYDSAVYSLEAAAAGNANMALLTNRVDGAVFSNRVHFPRTSRRLPQAIIVGVRKCGTRALLEMLALHPRVQKAAGEVHFFDRDDNYRRGLEWYRRKMPHSFRGQITIEKSPSYFVTPEVPERIRAMNASVKLLLIVREPVTRAISDYTQLRSHAATVTPQQPAAQRSFEQLALRTDGSVNLAYRPLAISLYHTFLHRWLEVFRRPQILVVNGDLLIEDPVPQLHRIEHFLGLEPRIGRHNFYFNHTKGFFCLRNETADKCLRESKGRRHPRVDPVVVTKLRRFFSEHNQRFYDLVGEDLGWPEE
ncbi:heparan sulfate glucosamine 3-O-sulfotransferase 1 [Periplaneta americana]|uniref:heparan sulfate glucosamine 3-O-sulfotransferase 1 n=1 Tax=Periplaneta americana TaxID=6978 RepID=UPI0037E91EC8